MIDTLVPLSQSRYERMACPASYVYSEVYGVQSPDNEHSTLGVEVHSILEEWYHHLKSTKQTHNALWLEVRLKGVSNEAAEILTHFLETFTLNPQTIVAQEAYLKGGDDLEGRLDCITSEGAGRYRILDWKNYHRVIEANTFQSKLYPLLVFLNYPDADFVSFTLVFTRYGCVRSVDYSRADVPQLMEEVARARERQVAMHLDPQKYEKQAVPGSHCIYCPLLRMRDCPIDGRNPYEMDPKDRLLWQAYLKQAIRANDEMLKDLALHSTIQATDNNGTTTEASFVLKETVQYPMGETLVKLNDWREATGDDLIADLHISRSALKAKLKAKKRAVLDQALDDIAVREQRTEFQISEVE